jgi:hypothetical protein
MSTDSRRSDSVVVGGRLARLDTATRLAVAIGGLVALLILFRSIYLSFTGQRQYSSLLNVVLYYILPAGASTVLFCAIWMNGIQRLRLLLLSLSVIGSLYAVELALFMRRTTIRPGSAIDTVLLAEDRKAAAASLAKRFGVTVDGRIATEVLAEIQQTDPRAVPLVTPSNHLLLAGPDGRMTSPITIDGKEVVPLGGASDRQTLLCNENGYWVQYRSDSRGFNNDDSLWHAARNDIVVLGDSFAHGYCVPPGRSFVDLIRRQHARTLNLGLAGNGPLMMLASLSEYVPQLRPRIVLWFYFEGNDLENLQTERRNAVLSNYLEDGFTQSALARRDDIDAAIVSQIPRITAGAQELAASRRRAMERPWAAMADSASEFWSELSRLMFLREGLGLIEPTDPRDIEDDHANMKALREALQKAQTRTQSAQGRLYFVYLPAWERYAGRYHTLGLQRRDEVLSMVADLAIPVIDLEPILRSLRDPLSAFPFRAVGHYTETGHQLVADAVLREVASLAMPPPRSAPQGDSKHDHTQGQF